MVLRIADYIADWSTSPFASVQAPPWQVVRQAEALVLRNLGALSSDYRPVEEFRIHVSATVEAGAILKGAGIIGPRCLVAAGAYLRGGIYLAADCTVGPNAELKSSFMFAGSKLAHLNFVGDSVLGSRVNVEAGAIIANYRNELADKTIRILHDGVITDTGIDKFGALIGDDVRIGANAVIAPGAILAPGSKLGRLELLDQYPG